jgi:hypothetical protein
MTETTIETRPGFKIHTITLKSGEELKYPSVNHDDLENLSAGFLKEYRKLSKAHESADTDREKGQIGTDLHWVMLEAVLTLSELKSWEKLNQPKFYEGMNLGIETAGLDEKK